MGAFLELALAACRPLAAPRASARSHEDPGLKVSGPARAAPSSRTAQQSAARGQVFDCAPAPDQNRSPAPSWDQIREAAAAPFWDQIREAAAAPFWDQIREAAAALPWDQIREAAAALPWGQIREAAAALPWGQIQQWLAAPA